MKQYKELLLSARSKVSMFVIAITTVVGVAQGQPSSLAGLPDVTTIHSTVPKNSDINPYGVFRIPRTVGRLTKGNILISNFNNSSNSQGTGTTLVQISPSGSFSLFAQIDADDAPDCPGGIGLTTALVVLRSGWVVVGSLPTKDGTAATAQAGCLLILNSNGKVVETIFGTLISGPWDMTVFDGSDQDTNDQSQAMLFVTNVLNGTVAGGGRVVPKATVVRVNLTLSPGAPPFVESLTVIGSGFAERTDPAALVIGPTGVALSPGLDLLYVADSLNNRIAAIPNPLFRWSSASTGFTVSQGGALNDPLGMTLEASGDILTTNGNDGFLVETTPDGRQISKVLLDNTGSPPGAGTLFGLTFVPGQGVYFVDDGSNTLNRFH